MEDKNTSNGVVSVTKDVKVEIRPLCIIQTPFHLKEYTYLEDGTKKLVSETKIGETTPRSITFPFMGDGEFWDKMFHSVLTGDRNTSMNLRAALGSQFAINPVVYSYATQSIVQGKPIVTNVMADSDLSSDIPSSLRWMMLWPRFSRVTENDLSPFIKGMRLMITCWFWWMLTSSVPTFTSVDGRMLSLKTTSNISSYSYDVRVAFERNLPKYYEILNMYL